MAARAFDRRPLVRLTGGGHGGPPLQFDCERCSPLRAVCCGECAAVLCDYPVSQRQSHAVAFGFGRKERNEDLLQMS